MPLKVYKTIIIGGGPAGLFTAISIGRDDTLVLEKNSQPGKKLLIAGSGRCNVTHTGPISDFFGRYGSHGSFVKKALKEFTNDDLISFLIHRGLNTVVDKNGKVFPETDRAEDVLACLLAECRAKGIEIKREIPVVSVSKANDLFVVTTGKESFCCEALVVATGGSSYPTTGSSGDGYMFAKSLGHSIVTPKPALTPVFVKDYRMSELAGVSLQNASVSLYRGDKKLLERRGDIGFTHKGISGPGIIDFSRYFEVNDVLRINLIGCNEDRFRQLFIDSVVNQGNTTVQSLLRNYDIPKSLMRFVLEEVVIDPSDCLSNVSAQKRNKLIVLLCSYPFHIERVGGFKMAMTTAGGVCLDEVSSKTMESKLVSNLYFVGEVLDVDGDTGGYNIQAAFSTGCVAGKSIVKLIGEK
jgi:predicted Rossmann fold flavoprotein